MGESAAVETWLDAFNTALTSRNTAAAADLFEEDGLWRDFVSFTWNLKTLEGRGEITDMLDAVLDHVQPAGWELTEQPTEADGVTEAWVSFETAAARGWGHLRLRNGKHGPC